MGTASPLTTTIRSYIASSWPVLLPVAGLLGLSIALFPSAGRDDAYITYWAAHTLREFGEIANINGAHIEQSTSLLHVLVLGVLSFVTKLSVPEIGPPMSVVFGIVTVIYTYEFARLYVGAMVRRGRGDDRGDGGPVRVLDDGGTRRHDDGAGRDRASLPPHTVHRKARRRETACNGVGRHGVRSCSRGRRLSS